MNSPALETATEPGTLPRVDKDAARKPGKFQISPEVKASLERTQSQDDGSGYVSDRHNSSGVHVKFWQEQINSYRLSKGILPIPETGTVDKVTTEAIKEMQRDLGVADDGVIGPRTFRAFALKYQGGSDQVDGLFFQDFQVRLLSQVEYDEMLAASSSRRRNSILGVDLSGLMNLSGSAVFEKLMPMIFKVEGWLSNDADDRGGVTLAGITWGAYKSYMQGKGTTLSRSEAESQLIEYSKQPREIFEKIASDIYLENYWNPSGCEKLPPLIAAVHFDAAVNHGVGGAEKLLSRTLEKAGVSLEGLSGISEEEQTRIAKIYIDERKEYYNDIISNRPSQEKFRDGWMNRLDIVSNSLNSVHGLGIKSDASTSEGLQSHVALAKDEIASKFSSEITNIHGHSERNIAGTHTKSDHAKGLAVDFMVREKCGEGGDAIAKYCVENAERLNLKYVIWNDKIYSPSKGWRPYKHPSGSNDDTLQHRDHVHASFLS